MIFGIIKEGKIPTDNRVALTPQQCKWILENHKDISIKVQPSPSRCFPDKMYAAAGAQITDNLQDCDILLGIKEVPVDMLIPNKTYLFFSHTIKMQPYNQKLLQSILQQKITLIDYECLEHQDGTRVIGFGFFAGIVGAHNGMYAYGKRSGSFHLDRINPNKGLNHLMHTYFGLKIPNLKIAITGTGRVGHGILEIMNLLGIHEVDADEFVEKSFSYPVYVHLKGNDLYERKDGKPYQRDDFHAHPEKYKNKFLKFLPHTDILMNGIFWQAGIPRLFEREDLQNPDFKIQTIADITDDKYGSVPCNLGDSSIEDPVYGVNKQSFEKTEPYLPGSVDVMAVGNLPNELPRDASQYFGEQMIKFILPDLLKGNSTMIDQATIASDGKLTPRYQYLEKFANGE